MILLFLLLTCLTSLTSAAVCPPSEDLSPCKCIKSLFWDALDIHCFGSDLTHVQKSMEALRGKKVRELQFENVKLGKLPANIFEGMNVDTLAFLNCEMTDLTDSPDALAFSGLEDSLQILLLEGSIQGSMTAPVLKHMRKLKDIEITKIDIGELTAEWLAGMPENLEDLTLDDNKITTIGPKALAGFKNLELISIYSQKLTDFRRDVLPRPATKLEEIILSENGLTGLPEDMFEDMPALDYVDITYNQIKKLPDVTWSSIWPKLRFFLASENPLECDEHIGWMFKMKIPETITGRCEGPESRAGRSLRSVIVDNSE